MSANNAANLADAKTGIRKRSDNFEAFFKAGDAAGLVNDYYVEEPMMSAPDMALLKGKPAIEALFTEIMKPFAECRLEQVEVRAEGDMAYEISSAFLKPKDANEPVVSCRYLIVWRKCVDGWRVDSDFFAYGSLLG